MSDIMDTTSKTASAAEATDLIKNGHLIATKSVQDYNTSSSNLLIPIPKWLSIFR
jgi:hypothetical protein